MAKFSRIEVYQAMTNTGLIPVFYHADVKTVKSVVKACYEGGVRVFEFSNRGDFAHEVFAQLIKWVEIECPEMILGIGTVIDAPTAALYMQLGANYIVSPLLSPDIFSMCNRRQIAYLPGCATTTEIGYALELGAEIVKVFPGENIGGASFVKNIKGPIPWAKVMVTGGVEPTDESLSDWFKSGVTCVAMGSNLFPKEVIQKQKWTTITELCKKSLYIIENYK